MGKQNLVRNVPLKEQLQDILKMRIREGSYPSESLFPSEAELSVEFEVSRATVRSALAVLQAEGHIVRKHGIGTFVSKLSKIKNPINRVMEFGDLISSGGYVPGVVTHKSELLEVSDMLASNLGVENGTRVLVLNKTFTADDEPVVTLQTSIPEWILNEKAKDVADNPEMTEPFFDFLENICGHRVEKMVASFWPDTIQNSGFDIAGFDSMTPVLIMEYIAYNHEETPIYHSMQAYLSKHMKFNLIRLRDDI